MIQVPIEIHTTLGHIFMLAIVLLAMVCAILWIAGKWAEHWLRSHKDILLSMLGQVMPNITNLTSSESDPQSPPDRGIEMVCAQHGRCRSHYVMCEDCETIYSIESDLQTQCDCGVQLMPAIGIFAEPPDFKPPFSARLVCDDCAHRLLIHEKHCT